MQAAVGRGLSGAIILGALCLCPIAGAQGARVQLQWQAPPGCPGREPVLEKLTELVGPDPLSRSRYRSLRGEIRVDDRLGWVLELELADDEGTRKRTLNARACDDLATAAAVALALVLDPEASLDAEWQAAAPAPLAPSRPEPVAAPSSIRDSGAEEATPEPAAPVAPLLAVEGLLDSAALGGMSIGLGVHGAARLGRWSLGLSGVYLPEHQTPVRVGQWVELTLVAVGPRACHRLLSGGVRAHACAAFELGEIIGTGVGLRGARETSDWWLAPSLGLGLDWIVFSDVALAAHVDALTPLTRKEYVINETEVVHRVPAALIRLGFGLKLAPE
jgi:hypothetical protein